MMEYYWKKWKDSLMRFGQQRILILLLVFLALFAILAIRLFRLQILEGEEHQKNFKYKSLKTLEVTGNRGNIYDTNGKLLASNKLAYHVTFDNSTAFSDIAKEWGDEATADSVKNEAIYRIVSMLESNGDHVQSEFPISINSNGKYRFTVSGDALKEFRYESFGINDDSDLSIQQRKQLQFSAKEMFMYYRNGYGSTTNDPYYNVSEEYSEEDALKIVSVRYQLSRNMYTQYEPVPIAYKISEKSRAEINENPDIYIGASVVAETIRVYEDAKYFSHMIGYTGTISEEEMSAYNDGVSKNSKEYYTMNDEVGKIGIEKEFEEELRGYDGQKEVYVDSTGNILEEVNHEPATQGNDIYLSIDADLQKYCYDMLEQKLSGILLSNMTSGDATRGEKDAVLIPYWKVLYALIDNNIIDASKFSKTDATKEEQKVYQDFEKEASSIIRHLKKKTILSGKNIEDMDGFEWECTMKVYSVIKDTLGLVKVDEVDENAETFQRWKEGEASLKEYLTFLIESEYIDLELLNASAPNGDTAMEQIVELVKKEIAEDSEFDKLIYKYMIKSGRVSGKVICLALYHQNVLNKTDSEYERLKNGSLDPYSFLRIKIKNLEITPAQLALEPCSGSIIVTDPNTGKVKALVAYPSYDNNRLANGVDAAYYQQLREDKSSPLLNRALNSKTAPGSTYKIVSAVAGIKEEVITTNTYLVCNGIYEKVIPHAKCWIYPNAHGYVSVSDAIAASCNSFFYEVGRRLGLEKKEMKEEKALSKLKEYAGLFGLTSKSGIELPEDEPHPSDEDPVRSAIGQGTNSYTPSQLARYITTVANDGHCYELSIIDSIKDSSGETSRYQKPNETNTVSLDTNTWSAIHSGLSRVISENSNLSALFEDLPFTVSGKTGTAEENLNKSNHALFVSYGPSSSPEITVTTVVPNGYSSANAADISSNVYRYYFERESNISFQD
ncbi:MAG: penicillin-binding transpeptidase domain-containing protein [Lachnospiraceae bacterium]